MMLAANKSDEDLLNFLCDADQETVLGLAEMLNAILTFWPKPFKHVKAVADVPAARTDERQDLAKKMVDVFLYHGSNLLVFLACRLARAEPGKHYHDVLRTVIVFLNEQLKPTILDRIKNRYFGKQNSKKPLEVPRVATVAEYKEMLTTILLQIRFNGKKEAEILQMMREAGLDQESAERAAKELAHGGAVGGGVVALVKVLGKKTVTKIIEAVLAKLLTKLLGKEAATKILERLLTQLPQKVIARLVSGVGWGLLAWDLLKLTGPSKRIIVPFVCTVAAIRTNARLSGN